MNAVLRAVMVVSLLLCAQGCWLKKPSGDVTVGDGSGSGGTPGAATPTPSPTPTGMYCTDTNGWDRLGQYPVLSNTTITGTAINSVKFKIHYAKSLNGDPMSGATTYSTPMSLKAYTCGSSSSLGSLQGTASATVALNGSDKDVVFTFSTPIAIPTGSACGANPYPLVFEFVGAGGNVSGYELMAQSTLTSAACASPQSSTSSGVVPRVRAWTTIISATP